MTIRSHANSAWAEDLRSIRQGPLPNAVQFTPLTSLSLSNRGGGTLAEAAIVKTTNGNADKADDSKPAHYKLPNMRSKSLHLPLAVGDRLDLLDVPRFAVLLTRWSRCLIRCKIAAAEPARNSHQSSAVALLL